MYVLADEKVVHFIINFEYIQLNRIMASWSKHFFKVYAYVLYEQIEQYVLRRFDMSFSGFNIFLFVVLKEYTTFCFLRCKQDINDIMLDLLFKPIF